MQPGKLKIHFILLLLSFISTKAFSQKNFEGIIIYKMTAENKNENAEITAYFSNQKIKAEVNKWDSNSRRKDNLIMDFEKGIVYYIDKKKKTYRAENMLDKKMERMPDIEPFTEKNKQVLGYNCTAYQIKDTTKSDFMGPMNFCFWYADSLYFTIKEQYRSIDMVPMFTNGISVSMGMKMDIGLDEKAASAMLIPISISQQIIPDSIFSLAGFQLKAVNLQETFQMTDSVQAAVDSIMEKVKEAKKILPGKSKKSLQKKSPAKNTHTQPTKSVAIKPKQ